MIGETNATTSGQGYAFIVVDYPAGSRCTATNGIRTLNATDTSGHMRFAIPEPDNVNEQDWTVTTTNGTDSMSRTFNIHEEGQVETIELYYYYGIKRLITSSSPTWARYGMSANYTATGSIGTAAGASDFSNYYPWNEISRVVHPTTEDVMIKIPKFGFKRYIDEDEYEHIEIYPQAGQDHPWHMAFRHNNAVQNYIYVGAYSMGANFVSQTGLAPLNNITRAACRTGASNKGSGWGIIDMSTYMAIVAIFLVEFATNNSQAAIGAGYTNASNGGIGRNSGQCDNVPNLTGRPAGTDAAQNVIYRGIENPWGNMSLFIDGINAHQNSIYICNNQSQYQDDTIENYTLLNYTLPSVTATYITRMGYDSNFPEVMFPCAASGGSATTYYCDQTWYNSSDVFCTTNVGGTRNSNQSAGLFVTGSDLVSSSTAAYFSSRLLYIPPTSNDEF